MLRAGAEAPIQNAAVRNLLNECEHRLVSALQRDAQRDGRGHQHTVSSEVAVLYLKHSEGSLARGEGESAPATN